MKSMGLYTPTVVLGHEEDDDPLKFWADRSTGEPTYGVVAKLWVDGDDLMADLGDMTKEIADAIRAKHYRKCSVELYDDYEHEGKSFGLALRRLALLGAEIPQVKALGDLQDGTLANDGLLGIKIFSTGTHPTKNGPRDYTTADLNQIVQNFNNLCAAADETTDVDKIKQAAKFSEVKPQQIIHTFSERAQPRIWQSKDLRWHWKKTLPVKKFSECGCDDCQEGKSCPCDSTQSAKQKFADARSILLKFCREGPNAGKPGPCPGAKGKAKAAKAKPEQPAQETKPESKPSIWSKIGSGVVDRIKAAFTSDSTLRESLTPKPEKQDLNAQAKKDETEHKQWLKTPEGKAFKAKAKAKQEKVQGVLKRVKQKTSKAAK
jgi:hypothetical protein